MVIEIQVDLREMLISANEALSKTSKNPYCFLSSRVTIEQLKIGIIALDSVLDKEPPLKYMGIKLFPVYGCPTGMFFPISSRESLDIFYELYNESTRSKSEAFLEAYLLCQSGC